MTTLRDWPADAQVGLLFVALFGALAAVTGIAAVLASRDRLPMDPARWSRFKVELGVTWVGASLFWLAWISGPIGANLLFALVSFLALREYITLMDTRRADHRSLLLAFFAVLPLQYVWVGLARADLFSLFIPVYMFFAVPVVSALAGDPHRFIERNAKIQWGLMVCVYGLSHATALLTMPGAHFQGRGAFLLLFMVMVVAGGHLVLGWAERHFVGAQAVAGDIDRHFSWRAWGAACLAGALIGLALSWITPFTALQATLVAAVVSGAGTVGELVMRAGKRDAGVRWWRDAPSVTGAIGLLDRVAPLCFAAPVFFHLLRRITPHAAG